MKRYFAISVLFACFWFSAPAPAISAEDHYPEVTVQAVVENREFYDGQKVSLYAAILGVSMAKTEEGNTIPFIVLGAGEGYHIYVLLPMDYAHQPTTKTHITVIGTYHMSRDLEGITIKHFIEPAYLM